MGRHLTSSSGSKHLMHVANKHLGDDPDCDSVSIEYGACLADNKNPQYYGSVTTGGNCAPCDTDINPATSCYGDDALPCHWDMVIEGVNPLSGYSDIVQGNCAGFSHRRYPKSYWTSTYGVRSKWMDCSNNDCGKGLGWFNHIGTQPTVDINGTYLFHNPPGTYSLHFDDEIDLSDLAGNCCRKSYTTLAEDGPYNLDMYMTYYSCSGGRSHPSKGFDKVNPASYNMPDGVNIFLVFSTNRDTLCGSEDVSGMPYQSRVEQCIWNHANVFAATLPNFQCLGTNTFRNRFTGPYIPDHTMPPHVLAAFGRRSKLIVPYYAGGTITLIPRQDSFYE